MTAKTAGKAQKRNRMHYEVLRRHAGDCLQCGMCETRCPFDVKIRENMKHAEKVFGL